MTDKLATFRQVLAETGLKPPQVCYLGDDLPDLPLVRTVGLGVAVADGCAELRGRPIASLPLPAAAGPSAKSSS